MKKSTNLFCSSIRRFLSGVSCTAAGLCVCAPLYGAVLLEDDFSGSVLDTSKWVVDDYNGNKYGAGAVDIVDGMAQIKYRANLSTVPEFDLFSDETLVGGLDISGQFKLTTGREFFQFLTRSDGSPTASYGETKTGVELAVRPENNSIFLTKRSLNFTTTDNFKNFRTDATPDYPLPQLNELYNFRLVDTGGPTGNAYFEVSTLDGSQVWNYSYRFTGMTASPHNHIAIHNRETETGLYLDNIRIATAFDSATPYLSDDFDNGLAPTKWTTLHPRGGSISVSDNTVKIVQRSYLNTFQNFDPAAFGEDAPLTITMDWSMSGTADMLQVLTRADGLSGASYGESNSGLEFMVADTGVLHIVARSNGSATTLVTSGDSKLTKYANIAYAVTITDNGSDLTFDVYEKGNPANRVTLTANSEHRIGAADGQFVSIHNREHEGITATLDNVNIYYATSDFQDVGSLEWTENGLAATAYRQNAEGAVINTIPTGTAGVTADKSGWQLYQGPTANPADAVFIQGGDGMLGSPNSPEVFKEHGGFFTFENETVESNHWTVVSQGRPSGPFVRFGNTQSNPTLTGDYLLSPGGYEESGFGADNGQDAVGIVRSLQFQLTGEGTISFDSYGGMGGTESIVGLTSAELIQNGLSSTGFLGAGLRLVENDEYVLSERRSKNDAARLTVSFSEDDLAALYEADPDAWYTLDFIDALDGGWGWVTFDDVSIPYLADALSIDQNQFQFLYVDGSLVAMTGDGDFSSVPEPASIILLLLGSAGLYFVRRKK